MSDCSYRKIQCPWSPGWQNSGFNDRRAHQRWNQGNWKLQRIYSSDDSGNWQKILNAVELEKARNIDKPIPLSNSNLFTKSLEIGKEKLPKINLKKFYDNPISFNPFWDSFARAVDDNPGLSDVDKFNYLGNSLEGPAAGAIQGLLLTPKNYKSVKALLKKWFGQPQVIINAHMEGLVKISAVSIDNDLRCLGLLCDQVEAHVQALQALEINSESYGKLLIPSLVEKLPPNIPLIISRAMDQP